MQQRKLKSKVCRGCGDKFIPWNSTQQVCNTVCAIEYQDRKKEKALKRDIKQADKIKRKDIRKRKDKLKSKSDYMREAQTACNAYIRARDGKKCISCGTEKPDIQYCAGHFKTRGAHPSLRFHPFNISAQCNKRCNLMLSGNIAEYRPNLINKIGIDNILWLEGPHKAQNLTIDDIVEIKQYYREQLKLLKGD